MKDFDIWNNHKKLIESTDHTQIVFSEREVWWAALGNNIGDEEDGKNELFERPVLILRKFSVHTCLILPLTSQGKDSLPFYYKLPSQEMSYVILSQIRLISSKRLLRKMYRVGRGEFSKIQNSLEKLILTNRKPAD